MNDDTPRRVRKIKGTMHGTVEHVTVAPDGADVRWDDGQSSWSHWGNLVLLASDETPAERPRADRWELAPEPEPGTVVQDRNGMVWVRDTHARGWFRGGSNRNVAPWSTVLSGAPLVRLVPADEPTQVPDDVARRWRAERDEARERYSTLRDAALKVVTATSAETRRATITALGHALDRVMGVGEPAPVSTHDRDAILKRAAATSDRHRKAVVSAARRVLDAVDNDSEAVLVPMTDLRNAVAALDRYQSLAERCLTETGTD